jgi:hypothetical protein
MLLFQYSEFSSAVIFSTVFSSFMLNTLLPSWSLACRYFVTSWTYCKHGDWWWSWSMCLSFGSDDWFLLVTWLAFVEKKEISCLCSMRISKVELSGPEFIWCNSADSSTWSTVGWSSARLLVLCWCFVLQYVTPNNIVVVFFLLCWHQTGFYGELAWDNIPTWALVSNILFEKMNVHLCNVNYTLMG